MRGKNLTVFKRLCTVIFRLVEVDFVHYRVKGRGGESDRTSDLFLSSLLPDWENARSSFLSTE